jgi:hypothetical protein
VPDVTNGKASPELIAKVERALSQRFPDARLNVGPGAHDHIHVLITWPGFTGLADSQRQDLVWDAIDDSDLTLPEKVTITMILPQTPQEVRR